MHEILLHNIGHHDLYLLMESDEKLVVGRPKNVFVNTITRKIVEHLETDEPSFLETSNGRHVGIRFGGPLDLEYDRSRILARFDMSKSDAKAVTDTTKTVGIFFPILSSVLEEWLASSAACEERTLALVCTAPAEKNLSGTSTKFVSELAGRYAISKCPTLRLDHVPPIVSDPFRYDNMVPFVRTKLVPMIDEHRRRAVESAGEDWKKELALTLSVSTGTTPVMTAIYSSLRSYRPEVLHVAKARVRADIEKQLEVERYSFAEMELSPARDVRELEQDEPEAFGLVAEMRAWRDEFRAHLEGNHTDSDGNELMSFWMRKGRKPVLAVLQLLRNGEHRYVRACNLEVSLPTGTLCAERNAIGTALARYPDLRREQIRRVAVVSLADEEINPLAPCGACREWLLKLAAVNPDFEVLTFPNDRCESVFSERIVGA